jgi:hypothetical protein
MRDVLVKKERRKEEEDNDDPRRKLWSSQALAGPFDAPLIILSTEYSVDKLRIDYYQALAVCLYIHILS